MKLALRAGDDFCFAGCLSGAVDVAADQTLRSDDDFMSDIYGSPERVKGSDDDLFALAAKRAASGKPLPKIFMWCGTEDFLYAFNTRMRDHLTGAGLRPDLHGIRLRHMWNY